LPPRRPLPHLLCERRDEKGTRGGGRGGMGPKVVESRERRRGQEGRKREQTCPCAR
jgi:hypothetical protein